MKFVITLLWITQVAPSLAVEHPEGGHSGGGSEVTVSVDTEPDVWIVTVKNYGPDIVTYEMLEEFPRSLGIELWLQGQGREIYAGNNAELIGVFGNPADIRKIAPGESTVFKLDPQNVSAEDAETLRLWRYGIKHQMYDMRIVFRGFASRRIWRDGPDVADPEHSEQGETLKP